MVEIKGKNEINKILIEFNKLQTVSRLHNNLIKINLSTQNNKLRELLIPVIDLLNEANNHLYRNKKGTVKIKIDIKIEPYKSLINYCSTYNK
jgi:hypothetical protein